MKSLGSFAAGAAAGALLMYYLDVASGGRRRALVRDKLVAAGHGAADFAEAKGKRAADRVKGLVATGRLDRVSSSEPASDQQLHDRIRSRLGRVVSHPRALEVEVEQGHVRLTGHLLTKEVDALLDEVRGLAGVQSVENLAIAHDNADGVQQLQGRTDSPGKEQGKSGAWH